MVDESCYPAFLEHIKRVSELGSGLGAKILVFGSPKNRRRGQLSMSRAMEKASILLLRAEEICAGNIV